MAFAEYEVVVERDAMTVYRFLQDGLNLRSWREGIRNIELRSGAVGANGAVYQQTLAGPAGRPIAADFQITQLRPGAEIQFEVVAGPARPHGGYYLSSEGPNTRVRFALECRLKGVAGLMDFMILRTMKAEVCQLERLKQVLEAAPAEA